MTATRGGCAESLMLAGLGVAVLGQGAFHLRIQVVVGVLFAAAAAVAVAEPRRRVRVRALLADPVVRRACVLLAGALALVATWTVLAAGVAGYPAGALRPLALLAGVGVVVAVYATADASDRAGVVPALLGLGGLVALGGIVGVVLRVEPLGHVDGGLWRAAGPLTYANATAALLGVATLAAAGLAVRRGDDRRLGALLTLLLVGLAVTGSRGGLVAVTGGAVLLAGLVGVRRLLTVTLVPGLAALGAAAVLAASAPDGEPARPLLGGAAVALAVGLAAAGAWLGRARLAAVGNSSVPKPVPPRSAWAMTVRTTGALADAGRTATVHVDVTCPTGYKGVVVLDVVGRSTTKGSARAVGSASLTCTGATKGVDVVAAVNKKERKALKAGSAKVVAKFTGGPVDKRKGRGPGKNTTVQRTVTLG